MKRPPAIGSFRDGTSSGARRSNVLSKAITSLNSNVSSVDGENAVNSSALGHVTPEQFAELSDGVWDDPAPTSAAEAIARIAIRLRALAGVKL